MRENYPFVRPTLGRLNCPQNENPFQTPLMQVSIRKTHFAWVSRYLKTNCPLITFFEMDFLLVSPGGYQESEFPPDCRHVVRMIPSFDCPIHIAHCDFDILAREPFGRFPPIDMAAISLFHRELDILRLIRQAPPVCILRESPED